MGYEHEHVRVWRRRGRRARVAIKLSRPHLARPVIPLHVRNGRPGPGRGALDLVVVANAKGKHRDEKNKLHKNCYPEWYPAFTIIVKLIITIATRRLSLWPLPHAILTHVRFGPTHRGRPARSRVVKGKRYATSPVWLARGQIQVNVRIYVATSSLVHVHCNRYSTRNNIAIASTNIL